MEDAQPREVTQLLVAWSAGDRSALDRLVPLVQAELQRLARRHLSRESPGHTLQPTALINEAYLRMVEWQSVALQDRAHFFAVAAKMMRRILVTHAVTRGRQKRGGGLLMVSLDEAHHLPGEPAAEVVALNEALNKLEKMDERKSHLVELRFFGGLSEEEAAGILNSSLRTVQREWRLARAWLYRELRNVPGTENG